MIKVVDLAVGCNRRNIISGITHVVSYYMGSHLPWRVRTLDMVSASPPLHMQEERRVLYERSGGDGKTIVKIS